MPVQTFRYAACGGGNVLWGIFLYAIGYNFLFQKHNVDLGHWPVVKHVVIKSYIAADYLFALWINFFTGFYLNRYIVFTGSNLQKHVQLFRYGVIVVLNMVFNYILLKLFVQIFHWYPTPSKITTTLILIVFSYYSQKYFSFKEDNLKLDQSL